MILHGIYLCKKNMDAARYVLTIIMLLLIASGNAYGQQTDDRDEIISFNGTYQTLSVPLSDTVEGKIPGSSVRLPHFRPASISKIPKLAIKVNLLYGATLTPNAGFELGLGKRSTLDVSAGYNFYDSCQDRQWRHWIVMTEYRYWLCERFNGLFIGAHIFGGQFNYAKINFPFNVLPNLGDNRYEGDYYGAGFVVGNQWILGKRWSLEAALGVGYARVVYDKYGCNECGPPDESAATNYFGPTRAAVSFMYFF